ncbi:MAG: putative toxin-antitoxin system toxin component, PIN family [Gammaproteobacteria bacterium]
MNPRLWVVDTNVAVAAILAADTEAPPARILQAMHAEGLRFMLNVELLAEYRRVLLRPRIRSRHGLDENEVDEILHTLAIQAVITDTSARTESAPGPGGNHLWRLLAAKPDAGLITGDALLIANPPPERKILTPREFIEPL